MRILRDFEEFKNKEFKNSLDKLIPKKMIPIVIEKTKINPYKKACELKDKDLNNIIDNTRIVLGKAIKLGGTTIRSYESSEGVHGRFQNELLVHGKEICPNCHNKLEVVHINGRGTYYCKKCQK